MCTLHAKDPEAVVDRLMVPLARAGLSDDSATRLIAAAVDLIVYVDKIDETHLEGGKVHRHVTHVWETAGRSDGGGVALSTNLRSTARSTGRCWTRGPCRPPPR